MAKGWGVCMEFGTCEESRMHARPLEVQDGAGMGKERLGPLALCCCAPAQNSEELGIQNQTQLSSY